MDISRQQLFRKRCTRSQIVGVTCRLLSAIVTLCVKLIVKVISILASGISVTLFHRRSNYFDFFRTS